MIGPMLQRNKGQHCISITVFKQFTYTVMSYKKENNKKPNTNLQQGKHTHNSTKLLKL